MAGERTAPTEVLSPQDLGKMTYGAMLDIRDRLLSEPSFASATAKQFFRQKE